MKKLVSFFFASLISIFVFCAPAQALQLSPTWLTDMTGLISIETKKQIEEISQKFQTNNSLELYTIIVNQTENGLDAHRYIQQLFAENGLTSKDILVLLDVGDRKVEIFSGQESKISDLQVQSVISIAKPFLKSSDWNQGIISIDKSIVDSQEFTTSDLLVLIFLIILLLVIIAIVGPADFFISVLLSNDSSSGGGSSGGGSGGSSF